MDVTRCYGLEQYEISNFARSGHESAYVWRADGGGKNGVRKSVKYLRSLQDNSHNLRYWEGGDYISVGPGAHSRVTIHDGTRVAWCNVHEARVHCAE